MCKNITQQYRCWQNDIQIILNFCGIGSGYERRKYCSVLDNIRWEEVLVTGEIRVAVPNAGDIRLSGGDRPPYPLSNSSSSSNPHLYDQCIDCNGHIGMQLQPPDVFKGEVRRVPIWKRKIYVAQHECGVVKRYSLNLNRTMRVVRGWVTQSNLTTINLSSRVESTYNI